MNVRLAGIFVSLALASVVAAGGCGARYHAVTVGMVATPGVQIMSPTGGFNLVGGQQFAPPFATQCHRIRNLGRDPLVQQYDSARERGAQNVQVLVEGNPVPLQGVLALCQVANGSRAPGARSYELRVDPAYIEAASGGRISVMFESYPHGDGTQYSWILWLSDRSF